MPALHAKRLSFSYTNSVALIRDADLHLDSGWHGVVGANGAGKTTLLRLMAGELEPEAGEIICHPHGAPISYCPQEVEVLTHDVRAFAGREDGAARRLLGQLSLTPAELARWDTLSPGERKRWQVGAALAAEPAVLLLDEPTNHLDVEARTLLETALRDYRGVGLLVSHDRALFEALTHWTLRVHGGELHCWRGSYEQAKRSWEAEERERVDAYTRLKTEQKKSERRLADQRRRKEQGQAKIRTIKRTSHPNDTASRRPFRFARRRSKDMSLGHDIRKLHAEQERIASELSQFEFKKGIGRSLFVDFAPSPKRELFALSTDTLCAGERVLLRDVDVSVARDSRIRVAGPNGIGKTTLLCALLAKSRLPASKVLYLPQELGEREEIDLLERVLGLPPDARAQVMAIVAALGVDPAPLLASRRPSPGEARKLMMATGLGTQVYCLVLDEPTNHLDLPSIERLEEALAQYPGALLMVTHDDAFALRCTHTTWLLAEGRVGVR